MPHFICKYFDDLSVQELYELLQLREAVFQLEQNCLYKDIDNKDKKCFHLLMYKNEILVAYCRLVPKGISYAEYVSIGRVVSNMQYRKEGFGKVLMTKAIEELTALFPNDDIKISAQQYLEKFYTSFGFETTGASYLEDDIPHIAMIKKQTNL